VVLQILATTPNATQRIKPLAIGFPPLALSPRAVKTFPIRFKRPFLKGRT
jgi:hypothetical protein